MSPLIPFALRRRFEMIDFYIILIQRADGLLERGVMDLDAQDWALITGRGEVGSFSPGFF